MESISKIYSRLISLRANLPEKGWGISEKYVDEYNSLVESLSKEVKENLEEFKVPETELKKRVTSVTPSIPSIGQRGKTTYTDERFCERNFVLLKLEGLLNLLRLEQSGNKIGFRT